MAGMLKEFPEIFFSVQIDRRYTASSEKAFYFVCLSSMPEEKKEKSQQQALPELQRICSLFLMQDVIPTQKSLFSPAHHTPAESTVPALFLSMYDFQWNFSPIQGTMH